jgi:hypothetical protein
MVDRRINYDRGVIIRQHKRTGMDVFMYVDTPGVFLNAFGTSIDEKLASEAGFDIENLGKERMKRERMKAAMDAIELELAIADESGKEKVVLENQGFKVIDIGLGRHFVLDPEGNRLTQVALPLEQAKVLVQQLAPAPSKAPEKQPEAKPEKAK